MCVSNTILYKILKFCVSNIIFWVSNVIKYCSIYPQNLEQEMRIISNVRKSCMGLNIVCLITGDNVDKFCMHVSSSSKYFIINITTITMIIVWKISKFVSGIMIEDNDDDYMGFYLRYKKSRTHATFSSFCPFFNYHSISYLL